jgi:hypothetical protein
LKIPIPELRCVSQATAEREGYREITTPIHPARESQIFASVQNSLRRTDSVWVEHPGGKFSAARKQRELLAVEALADDDQRRERKGGRKAKEKGAIDSIEAKKGESQP